MSRLATQSEDDMIIAPLTPREREVLLCVLEAGNAKAAAPILGMGLQTVKNHLASIRRKTETRSTATAVYILMREHGAI